MRVDAAEFVPTSLDEAGTKEDATTPKGSGTALSADTPEFVPGQLSADVPEFVPGALAAGEWGGSGGKWEGHGYNTYSESVPYPGGGNFQYMDEEQFLTPQLLPPGVEENEKAEEEQWPSLGEAVKKVSKGVGKSNPAPAAEVASSGPVAGKGVGELKVQGKQMLWTVASDDCPEGTFLEDIEEGDSLKSCRFCVAGVLLRLEFFPAGTSLSGWGCFRGSVVRGEDKAEVRAFPQWEEERKQGYAWTEIQLRLQEA